MIPGRPRDSEEDGDAGDDLYEVLDLARDGRLTDVEPARQVRDASHHCPISGEDHHAARRACSTQPHPRPDLAGGWEA